MNEEKTRAMLKLAISRHLRENPGGAVVVNPDSLIDIIVVEFRKGEIPLHRKRPTEFIHAGFLCRRLPGSSLGRRGHAKSKFGWVILDLVSGDEIDRMVPDSHGGVSERQVCLRAEQLRALKDAKIG